MGGIAQDGAEGRASARERGGGGRSHAIYDVHQRWSYSEFPAYRAIISIHGSPAGKPVFQGRHDPFRGRAVSVIHVRLKGGKPRPASKRTVSTITPPSEAQLVTFSHNVALLAVADVQDGDAKHRRLHNALEEFPATRVELFIKERYLCWPGT